jgi:hypothetical protein
MKALRLLAASLFLLSGILHFYYVTKGTSDPYFVPSLVFGIIYFALGILLILNKKFAIWLGFIIPIIPLVSLFKVDIKSLDALGFIVLAIDLAVVICCLILLLKKKKN